MTAVMTSEMTLFEFIIPLVALAFAAIGYLLLRAEGRRLDRRSEDEAPDRELSSRV